MKKLLYAVVIFVFITATFVGCSGGLQAPSVSQTANSQSEIQTTDTHNAAVLIEPEQLISKQEAASLLGEPVEDGEKTRMESIGQESVFYDSVEEGSAAFMQISLYQLGTMPSGSTITPQEIFGGAKAGLDEPNDAVITGIGDECFTGTPGLHILANENYIVVSAGNSDNKGVQEILAQAGALAVKNLEEISK